MGEIRQLVGRCQLGCRHALAFLLGTAGNSNVLDHCRIAMVDEDRCDGGIQSGQKDRLKLLAVVIVFGWLVWYEAEFVFGFPLSGQARLVRLRHQRLDTNCAGHCIVSSLNFYLAFCRFARFAIRDDCEHHPLDDWNQFHGALWAV